MDVEWVISSSMIFFFSDRMWEEKQKKKKKKKRRLSPIISWESAKGVFEGRCVYRDGESSLV